MDQAVRQAAQNVRAVLKHRAEAVGVKGIGRGSISVSRAGAGEGGVRPGLFEDGGEAKEGERGVVHITSDRAGESVSLQGGAFEPGEGRDESPRSSDGWWSCSDGALTVEGGYYASLMYGPEFEFEEERGMAVWPGARFDPRMLAGYAALWHLFVYGEGARRTGGERGATFAAHAHACG